jgi:cytochrome c2
MMKERKPRHWQATSYWVLTLIGLLLAGCTTVQAQSSMGANRVLAGNPVAGQVALQTYGCHSCHLIPGVTGANSLVGPPLIGWAERSYIAGSLPNEPAYLVEWIRFPQAIEPGNAMPNLGVTEEDALNMAAYLYTLQRNQSWYAAATDFFRFDN